MRARSITLIASTCAWALLLGVPAHAASPGKNGKIAFGSEHDDAVQIYTMEPDGTGVIRLTNGPGGG